MPRRERMISVAVVVLAACNGGGREPSAGSGSAIAPGAARLRVTACAVADPRPSRMRFGFPEAAPDRAIPDRIQGGSGAGNTIGEVGSGIGAKATRPAPRIALGQIQISGGLDRVQVRRFVRMRLAQLDGCYTKALTADSIVAGTLTLRFDVTATGAVEAVAATGLGGTLPECATKVFKGSKFPSGEGTPNQVSVAIELSPPPPRPAALPLPTAWTPYAMVRAPAPADPGAVDAMKVALGAQVQELDACFGAVTGSVRALISVTADGHVQRARIGGLGVRSPELCLTRAIQKLAIAAPAAPVELACDLDRGEPQPWRVTREEYTVFDVDATKIQGPDDSTREGAYLVLATPDAPGSQVERAVIRASHGGLSIIAVTATGGAPVFVGIGPDLDTVIDGAGNLGIAVTDGVARVCTDGADPSQTARVIDPSRLDLLIADGLAACRTPCTAASVSVVGAYLAKDLVAVTAATRRAKLATIVSGQACPH